MYILYTSLSLSLSLSIYIYIYIIIWPDGTGEISYDRSKPNIALDHAGAWPGIERGEEKTSGGDNPPKQRFSNRSNVHANIETEPNTFRQTYVCNPTFR